MITYKYQTNRVQLCPYSTKGSAFPNRQVNQYYNSIIYPTFMCLKKTFRIFLLVIITPLVLRSADIPGIPQGWSDGYAYANSIRLHYYRAIPAPGKPIIVMAHGLSDNGLCWTTLTQKLQGQYDIYMVDTRGHGLSDPFTNTDDGATLVNDLVDFVKVMKFNKPILMGHSMGAATVMRIGAEYPELASSIIMLDPILRARAAPAAASQPSSSNATTTTAVATAPRASVPSSNRFGTPESMVAENNKSFKELVERGHRQNPLWDSVDVKYWALSKIQYHGPYTSVGANAMTGTMNIGNSLQMIKVPAIILKADTSPESRKNNEELAKAMPKGRIVHVNGAGHNLHHDKLDQTTQLIKDFLSKL